MLLNAYLHAYPFELWHTGWLMSDEYHEYLSVKYKLNCIITLNKLLWMLNAGSADSNLLASLSQVLNFTVYYDSTSGAGYPFSISLGNVVNNALARGDLGSDFLLQTSNILVKGIPGYNNIFQTINGTGSLLIGDVLNSLPLLLNIQAATNENKGYPYIIFVSFEERHN